MYPRNAWYVAATSREIACGDTLARTICENHIALFRGHDGTVAALFDQCPHRLYPLSAGTVCGSTLRCGYHGLRFDAAGQCVEIPSQQKIPASARVRAFPVREARGLVWLWPGDPDLAEATPLPAFATGPGYLAGLDLSFLDDTDNWGVAGPHLIEVHANFMLAVDNLLDLTHVAYVHAKTFDNAGVLGSERIIKPIGANQMIDFFRFKNPMSPPLRAAYMLDPAVKLYDSFLETYWQSPSVMVLVHGAVPEGRDREKEGTIVAGINCITPATRDTCHYFWSQSVYRNLHDGAVRDKWEAATRVAFAEDEVVLRTQQQNLSRFGSPDLGGDVGMVLKADKAIVLARRIVARMARAEAAENTVKGNP